MSAPSGGPSEPPLLREYQISVHHRHRFKNPEALRAFLIESMNAFRNGTGGSPQYLAVERLNEANFNAFSENQKSFSPLFDVFTIRKKKR